jgi:acetyltransferase-like isoleucine patch superfamily enzyme
VSDTGHAYEDPDVPILEQPLRPGRRLEIADGAWIGIGAAIIGNVRIGRNAVVGANTVVTSDVPDHTVVAGNPARVVRQRVDGAWRWEVPRS